MHFGHDEHIMYFLHLYKVNFNGPYHFWSHFCLKTDNIIQDKYIEFRVFDKNVRKYQIDYSILGYTFTK